MGQSRAAASAPRLAELNTYVPINVHAGPLTEDVLATFSVIVATECAPEELLRIDDIAHKHGLCFIAAQTYGLFGQIFCDFGPAFVVNDTNGENPVSIMIASITAVRFKGGGFAALAGAHRHLLHTYTGGERRGDVSGRAPPRL